MKANNILNILESNDKADVISLDVPLLMRICEFCREAKLSDVQLHQLTTNLINESKSGVLTIDNYENLVDGITSDEEAGLESEETVAESILSLSIAKNKCPVNGKEEAETVEDMEECPSELTDQSTEESMHYPKISDLLNML